MRRWQSRSGRLKLCILGRFTLIYLSRNIRWVLPLCFGAASGLVALLLHYFSGLSNLQVWKESNVFWIVGGVMATLSVWSINAYPTRVGIVVYALLIGLVAAGIAAFADDYILRILAQADAHQLFFLDSTFINRIFIALAVFLLITVIAAANKRIYELEARFSRQSGAEHLLRDAELFKLRQQLQPHFLYNSLNAINSLILIDSDKAQEMTGRLSDFLRASVRKDSNEAQPVDAELAYLEDYLAIESVRFGDRLQVVYHKAYTDDARIPPFLLQPLIENAIKFGLNGSSGIVEILIHIYLEDGMLVLTIVNPFDPLVVPPKGTGFGLEGIRRRLYLLYSRDDLVQTSASENIFTTTLKIPQLHVQSIAD